MTSQPRPFWQRLVQAVSAPVSSAATATLTHRAASGHAAMGSRLRPLALEQRFMFDGAGAVDAAHAAADTGANDATTGGGAADSAAALRHALSTATEKTAEGASAATVQRQEVVFVDGQVPNVGELLVGLPSSAEVVILDPSKDGLQQVAAYLQGREGLDAIHLFSHGADGTVQMGNIWLSSANLAEHSAALQGIGAALKVNGDLMLYGCDIGQGDKGQSFLDQLAAITGADVAASADDTGAAALGGNWSLERSSGAIETTALSISGYDSLMASTYSGGTVASAPTLGASSNLMKYVVGDFNGDGRADILYQAAGSNGDWFFAQSNSNGTFSTVTQGNSIFAGLVLGDGSTGGANFHAADFNGDGRIDLLAAPQSGPTMKLYLNIGSGFATQDVTGPAFGVRTLVGDFNGDGALDILYQTNGSASAWAMALNNGSAMPTFTTVTSASSNWPFGGITMPDFNAYNYKAADVDGDGFTDLIFVASGVQMRYFRNNNGVFVDLTSSAGLPTTTVSRAVVADFDGDGDADILYQVNGNGSAFRYIRNGNGTFVDVDQASSPFAGVVLPDIASQQFRVGDFDGDGDLDLISTSSTAASTSIFYQSGSLPKLVSSSPVDDSLTVTPNANITLTFDQAVTKGSGNIYIVRASDNAIIQTIAVSSGAVTGSGTTWTIDPPADMIAGVAYAVRIDNKTFANANGQVYTGIRDNTTLNFSVSAVAAPVIGNVNGDAVTYVEDATYVLLDNGSNATVTDADSANFSGGKMTVQITTGLASGEDVLFIRDQGNGANLIFVSGSLVIYNGLVVGTFTGGTNGNPLVITFTNNANPTTVSALVQNLAYRNSNSTEPSATPRTVSVSMDDGAGGTSSVSTIGIEIRPVNDAPVVNITATNPTYTENTSAVQLLSGATINTVEAGQLVKQMVFTVSGIVNGAAEKLVIDGTDVTLVQGTPVITSINNGISVSVSVSSGTATVTLDKAGGLSTAAAQTVLNNLSYRNDSESPTTVNRVVTLSTVSDDGGTTDGGQPTAAVGIFSTVTVVGVNDAPVLADGPYNFDTINEDTMATGVPISTILANHTMTDPDTGALRGVAIIAKTGSGTWQYSTDSSNWTDFGAVSSTSGLLIAWTTYIRYVPDGKNGETATLSFRGWDQTTGTASVNGIRSTADTTNNGGTTAFSIGTGAINQVVTSVNDAPVMIGVAPTLSSLTDTSINNGGSLVGDLLSGVTDVDTGALKGMAITSVTSIYGRWQYSINAGGTWSDVGTVSVTSALILTAQNMVRFVPDGIHGETASITYKAWGQTNATLGLQGTKTNTTTSGGTSAYSLSTDTATVVVTGVNDRPVVTLTGTAALWNEANNGPSNRIVVDSGVTVSDPDGPNPTSATVRLLTYYRPQDSLAFVNDQLTMGNIVGVWAPDTGYMTLTSAGNTATTAQFQAAMRAVTYGNSSDTPNTTSRTIQFQLTDGGSLSSIAVTRDVTVVAVNDSPVNNVPGSQTASQNAVLGFNTTNGNAISITDVDAGNGLMTVTLTAVNGTLTLSNLSGINMANGTGLNNVTMTIEGNRTNINAALQSLTFKGANNYIGAASIIIETNDNGNSGTGGAKSDVDTISINVIPVNPKVTNVSAQGLDRTVKIGDEVRISMTWDQVVNVDLSSGSPTLLLETGLVDRNAVYVSGTGTNTLVFKYTVQAGDISADLDFQSTAALQMNGAVISNNTSDLAILTLPTVGGVDSLGGRSNIVVDGVVPVVGSVSAPTDGTYIPGQNLDFTVNFSEAMTVDISGGIPRIAVILDTGGTVYAEYVSGSGASALVFRMTVLSGQIDSTGISLGSAIDLHGGAIADLAGNATVTTLNIVAALGNVNVDGVDPTVLSVAPPADGSYKAGSVLTFTVNASEAVQIGGLAPRLALDVGGVTRYATYLSGSGSDKLVFQYLVQNGDNDGDGIALSSIDLRGEQLTDLAGNDIDPTLGNVNLPGVRVDTTAPNVVGIVTVGTPVSNATGLSYTVTFDEDVTGVDTTDFTLAPTGTAAGSITGVTRVDARTYTVSVTGVSGAGTLGLNLNNGATVTDVAGNDISGGLTGDVYTVYPVVASIAPSVTSVTVPGNGTYAGGNNLDFTVNFSEAMTVDTNTGTPRIAITLDTGGTVYANYVSGSGGSALVFRMTVTSGQLDSNGITLANSIDTNGGQITDLAGNATVTTLNGVASLGNVNVDGVAPTVVSVVPPADGSYKAGSVLTFTVNASESVVLDTTSGTPRLVLDVGGVTRYASYVAGAASGALQFEYTVQAGDNAAGGLVVGAALDLNGSTARDAAGNSLVPGLNGVANTTGVRIDAEVPSASLSLDKTLLNAQQTAQLTVRFREAVIGLDVGDFTVTDGYLSGLASQDGGLTWTATLTAVAGKVQSNLQITLNNAGYTDLAGNAGVQTSWSGSYAIDTVLPAQPVLQLQSNTAGSVTVGVDALEAGAQWEYSLDGGQSWQAGHGATVAIGSPGLYALQVRQISAAGNRSEVAALSVDVAAVTVDTAPLSVPPRVEWPMAGIFGSGSGSRDESAVFSSAVFGSGGGSGMFGSGDAPPVVPGGGGAIFWSGSAGSGMPFGPSFFSAGVATDGSPLSLGFLGFGHAGDSLGGDGSSFSPVAPISPASAEPLVLLQKVGALDVSAAEQVDWKVPTTVFGHSDPLASVQLSMTLADGKPLPSWLKFDAQTGQLIGTPPPGFQGEMTLRLTARDSQGHAVSTTIELRARDASPAARVGMSEQLQRHAQLRAGQMTAQRLHL